MRPRGLVKRTVLAITAFLGVVAAVVVAAGIFLATQDFESYRGDVTAAVREATGRELVIAGELDLELLPSPRLTARRVRLANAPWGTRPDMLRFDLLEVEIRAWPLLLGELHVQRVVLSGAEIYLETDRDGHGNWLLDRPREDTGGAPDGTAAGAGGGDIPAIHNVVLRDITITYRDGLSGLQSTLALDKLVANASDGASRVLLAATGRYEDRVFGISGSVGSIASLVAAGRPYPVDLDFEIGETSLTAALEITLDAEPPVVVGRLSGSLLRDIYLPFLAAPGTGRGSLIDDEPLVLSGLRAIDVRLDLAIDRLESGGIVFEEVAAQVVLEDGRLVMGPLTAKVADGVVVAELDVDGGGDVPTVEVSFTGQKVEIGVFLDEFIGGHLFEGATDLDFTLAGIGRSTRAIAATLEGHMSVTMGEGRFENEDLRSLASDFLALVDPWAAGIDSDRINCMVLRFDVANGTATSKTVLLDAEALTIGGGGAFDLGRDRIDLVLDPRPRSDGLLSLAVPIEISGQLSDPSYSANAADAVGAVLLGVLMLPLTALVHLFSGRDGAGDTCLAAGGVADEPGKSAIRRAVEGFSRGIKNLFR